MTTQLSLIALTVLLTTACLSCDSGDPLVDGTLSVNLQLSGISPSAVPTSGGTLVTLTGRNIHREARFTVGQQAVEAIHGASDVGGRISFVAPAAAWGVHAVTVTNPDGQRQTLKQGLYYHAAQLQLEGERVALDDTDGQLRDVLTGDVDGDGRDDLVVRKTPWYSKQERYVLYLNRGDGQRLVKAQEITPSWPYKLSGQRGPLLLLKDVDGDGRADLVDHLGIYLATSKGRFAPVRRLVDLQDDQVCSVGAGAVAAGGGPGLLFVHGEPWSVYVKPCRQLSRYDATTGQITPVATLPATMAHDPALVLDLNGDNHLDLVFRGRLTGGYSAIVALFGPALDWQQRATLVGGFGALTALDADGDGDQDLVGMQTGCLGCKDNQPTQVVLGGAAVTSGKLAFTSHPGLCGHAQVDRFVGEGVKTDKGVKSLVTCSDGSLRGHLWAQGKPQNSGPPITSLGGQQVRSAALDADGAEDLVLYSESQLVLAHGSSTNPSRLSTAASIGLPAATAACEPIASPALAPGRFGKLGDVAVGRGEELSIVRRADLAAGLYKPRATLKFPGRCLVAINSCDLNGDGVDDLVVQAITPDRELEALETIHVKDSGLAQGAPITATKHKTTLTSWDFVELTDLNADGRCDVYWRFLVAGDGEHVVRSLSYKGGAKVLRQTSAPRNHLHQVLLDVDGDGAADQLTLTVPPQAQGSVFTMDTLTLRQNDASGGFAKERPLGPFKATDGTQLRCIFGFAAQATRDGATALWIVGHQDPCVAGTPSGSVYALLGSLSVTKDSGPAFSLKATTRLTRGMLPDADWTYWRLGSGDFNGDTVQDLRISARYNSTRTTIIPRSPDGGLLTAARLNLLEPPSVPSYDQGAPGSSMTTAVLDLDSDGLDDVIGHMKDYLDRLLIIPNTSR